MILGGQCFVAMFDALKVAWIRSLAFLRALPCSLVLSKPLLSWLARPGHGASYIPRWTPRYRPGSWSLSLSSVLSFRKGPKDSAILRIMKAHGRKPTLALEYFCRKTFLEGLTTVQTLRFGRVHLPPVSLFLQQMAKKKSLPGVISTKQNQQPHPLTVI